MASAILLGGQTLNRLQLALTKTTLEAKKHCLTHSPNILCNHGQYTQSYARWLVANVHRFDPHTLNEHSKHY